jgi:hypothetical protein
MRVITWLTTVLPFVMMIWLYDIIITLIRLTYQRYYTFAYARSSYLQERALIDAYVENCEAKGYKPWPDNN